MVDIRQEGRSQRSAPQKRQTAHLRRRTCCTPRKPSGWHRRGDKTQPPTGDDYMHQAPGHLSCSDLGWRKMQAQPSLPLCEVPENLNLSNLDLGSAHKPGPGSDSSQQSNLDSEQFRLGRHICCEQGQTQCGWIIVSTPHTCQWYLFAVFLPPQSTTEQVSLKKVTTTTPLVSGWKLDTEETSKQKKLK